MKKSIIRDTSLAPGGRLKIDWVKAHMPVLSVIRQEFVSQKPFSGLKVAMSIHLEAKTAYLAEVMRDGGAEVFITGSNPLSTQDDVAAALVDEGISVFAWYNATDQEYREHLEATLESGPRIVIDDGGDLVSLLHGDMSGLAQGVLGGCEETTTGVKRLRALDKAGRLLFPMVAVNDSLCKYLFDNRYGTGESVWSGIMRTTNLIVSGKNVVVMGYGWCGRGVAMKAKGLGARVIVCEVDPVRAIEACMDGYQVMRSDEAASIGDIFVTVTGCRDILHGKHFGLMKDGVIMANAGHFDVEINKEDLAGMSVNRRTARQNIEEYAMRDGRRLYLLGEGRLVNLAAGDGHPAEIMDMSFALQALCARYLLDSGKNLQKRVYNVPAEIDRRVAELKLLSMGIRIDKLTAEQEKYICSWVQG